MSYPEEPKGDIEYDVEKDVQSVEETNPDVAWNSYSLLRKLTSWGVEARGIFPVPPEERIGTHYSQIFFIWLSANLNVLSFSAGTLGPVVYGLSLRDTCLCILFFNLLCSALPAYLTTWGPKLGLRQMVQSRFSFGYFGVFFASILNLASMIGFCILSCILGGQTLSSVSDGHLSWTVGIVIIAVISLVVSFCGITVLGWYERLVWIPVLIVYVVAVGIGGHHLTSPPAAQPATASAVLSFASTLAGFVITYSPLASDFTTYYRPDVSSWKIFTYSYLGFNIPIILIQCLGAAVVVAAPNVPSWNAGYNNGNVGGLIEAMLSPAGNFGKFLTVLMALSVTGNVAPTLYSFCISFQLFVPILAVIPRYFFSIVATAIIIPLAIVGQTKFYDTLSNFLGLIGYWASAFGAVVLLEHLVIRRNRFESYDLRYWNKPWKLTTGIPAVASVILACGLIIPSMDQVWFVGPIAKHTGDIGFEMAFAVTAICYVPLRLFELRYKKLV
ncbi:hypothetical protein NM688_g8185 [Phlebia brevispora]|uniref:Uncharacterized protein n=1 Tax=Phlebia brevispora TaxID=194682 RepID=A0ACC1RW52_9APHY|nr:hypothetical protein NM688_g8185 [Phlebia brevispora]